VRSGDWLALVTLAFMVFIWRFPSPAMLRRRKLSRRQRIWVTAVLSVSVVGYTLWRFRQPIAAFLMSRYAWPGWAFMVLTAFFGLVTISVILTRSKLLRTLCETRLAIPACIGRPPDIGLWDCVSSWSMSAGILSIGPGDRGGVLRAGQSWSDVVLAFAGRITRGNLGVIVRAADPDNYDMLQITDEYIVPHHRKSPSASGAVWDVPSGKATRHRSNVRSRFCCSVLVTGNSVSMYINGQLVYRTLDFCTHPIGSVGFRCAPSGDESAEIDYVAVDLLIPVSGQ